MATDPEDWTCTICYDSFPASEKYCKIPDQTEGYYYRACATCLRTQFLSAQENEINYPVKWQRQILHPRQFPSAFNLTFIRAYEAKEVEYKAPALERVYCECGTFVAPMVDESARTSWLTLASSKLCSGCEARWCLRCAQRCGGFGVPHDCVPEKRLGERRLALGGLKKGKDFQICPGDGCGRTIELAEACNAMTCQCGTSFCYICGEQAEPESEHWLRVDGGCPRYGAADSGRAMFDDDFGHADDADADLAFALEERETWERGEGESTTFDFIRWSWQAAMMERTAYLAQLDIMSGGPENEARLIDEVHRAMEMYHPVSHSGVSEERWQELVEQHTTAVEEWLSGLQHFVTSGQGTATEHLGGDWLEFPPDHIFNMAIAEGREEAAAWVQQANATALEWIGDHDIEFPGSAVFDVGPGGATGESWRIRDMDMFDDVPALGLFKLVGGALLAKPQPWQVVEGRLEGGLFGLPAPDREPPTEHEGEIAEDEHIGDEAGEGESAGDKAAGGETAAGETAEDETAEDETVDDEAAEVESTRLALHAKEDILTIVAGEQFVRHFYYATGPDPALWHPVTWLMQPLDLLGAFFMDNLFIGVVNQPAYDELYGLEYREQLEIPGSWPREDEMGGLLYGDTLRPGLYSQDVFIMRAMLMAACFLIAVSCIIDWETVLRGQ